MSRLIKHEERRLKLEFEDCPLSIEFACFAHENLGR